MIYKNLDHVSTDPTTGRYEAQKEIMVQIKKIEALTEAPRSFGHFMMSVQQRTLLETLYQEYEALDY